MKKTWIVDRIEGEVALLEGPDGERPCVLSELPAGVSEGDVLDEALRPVEDAEELIRARAEARLRRLRARTPSSDIIEL